MLYADLPFSIITAPYLGALLSVIIETKLCFFGYKGIGYTETKLQLSGVDKSR